MLDCIPIHAYIDTTVETACPTLIAMGFVYHTLAFCFGLANILPTSTDGTLKRKRKCFRYISNRQDISKGQISCFKY